MLMAAFIKKEAPGVSQRCHQCRKAVTSWAIRCSTCKEVLCQDCDFNHNLTRPFHNPQCRKQKLDFSLPLKPTHGCWRKVFFCQISTFLRGIDKTSYCPRCPRSLVCKPIHFLQDNKMMSDNLLFIFNFDKKTFLVAIKSSKRPFY